MTKHTLSVSARDLTGRSVKRLRAQGQVPASVFGKAIKSVNIQVGAKEFSKLIRETGESTLIYLTVSGETSERPVLVRDISRHPVSSQILNISFNQVSLKEKVSTMVPVKVVGESPAETGKLGILVQQTDEVEVEALPTDMPEGFQVDASVLTEVDAAITVGDLKVDSSRISIKTDPETILVKIEPLAAEEKAETSAPAEGEGLAEGEAPTEEGTATTATEDVAKESKSE